MILVYQIHSVKLATKENEDYIKVYLRYKEIILDALIDLEEKTEVEVA